MNSSPSRPRPLRRKTVLLLLLALFLIPVAARAALFTFEDRPGSWRDADWSSTGSLPAASAASRGARAGAVRPHRRLEGRVRGAQLDRVQARECQAWTRYDVVGWGDPVRINGWAPDGRWYGTAPTVVRRYARRGGRKP